MRWSKQMAEIAIRVPNRELRAARFVVGAIVLGLVFSSLWSWGVFVPKYRLRAYVRDGLRGLPALSSQRWEKTSFRM